MGNEIKSLCRTILKFNKNVNMRQKKRQIKELAYQEAPKNKSELFWLYLNQFGRSFSNDCSNFLLWEQIIILS